MKKDNDKLNLNDRSGKKKVLIQILKTSRDSQEDKSPDRQEDISPVIKKKLGATSDNTPN